MTFSVRSHISKIACPNFTKFSVNVTSVAVARSFSDDNAIRYVLPVLWTTSCCGNYEFKRMPFNVRGAPATAELLLVVACSVRYKSRE